MNLQVAESTNLYLYEGFNKVSVSIRDEAVQQFGVFGFQSLVYVLSSLSSATQTTDASTEPDFVAARPGDVGNTPGV